MNTDQSLAAPPPVISDDDDLRRLRQKTIELSQEIDRACARVDDSPLRTTCVRELDALAIEEIAGATSSIVMVATVSLAATESRVAIARELLSAAARGVHVTLLLSPHDLKRPSTVTTLDTMRRCGIHVRIAMHAPSITLLVVDRRVALVRPVDTDELGVVLKGAHVCSAFAQLALAYWSRSYAPKGAASDTPPAWLTAHQRRQVLALLVSGDTDAVAARTLGVSLRTFRRYVRQLMDELGASSRFEAGFLAAERGWHTPLAVSRR